MLFGAGTEQQDRREIFKLAERIVIGTGGAVALWLRARRQRITELDLAHRERVAAETKVREELGLNATTATTPQERRVIDLYSTTGEQLGSAESPVRITALPALSVRPSSGNAEISGWTSCCWSTTKGPAEGTTSSHRVVRDASSKGRSCHVGLASSSSPAPFPIASNGQSGRCSRRGPHEQSREPVPFPRQNTRALAWGCRVGGLVEHLTPGRAVFVTASPHLVHRAIAARTCNGVRR